MCDMAQSVPAVTYRASPGKGGLIPRRGLFEVLDAAKRMILVSAAAGTGKTSLLRSWMAAGGGDDRTAWVSVRRAERDSQAFWLSLLDSLRATHIGSQLVRELTAAPDLNASTVVERLLDDLAALDEPLWLVIDDLHEVRSDEVFGQLEHLVGNAPAQLRVVLLTRRDPRLGLHRLRLEGQLTEIRGDDLRFTFDESRAMLEAAGVRLSDESLQALLGTTEGWAAGLRLAALSMARHPDPDWFAVSFSGRERAVAEYLLAEMLDAQPAEVSRLILRTSMLERVSGPLADRLTEGSGSERILAELEEAGAFVVALDPERSWFRYHHLFADLLALELRRTADDELPRLHIAAAEWFAEEGHPAEAIRHAQAAKNWSLAARLLADNWRSMYLDGQLATGRELLSAFPAEIVAANAELAVLAAGDRRAAGSLAEARRYLRLAAHLSASVPDERRARFEVQLALLRLALARAQNDLAAVADEAQRLLVWAEASESIEVGLGEDLGATALIDLGVAEIWAGQLEAADRHLEQGLAEARRIRRPLLELQALAHQALIGVLRSEATADDRARQAIELARAHGWEETASAAATAYIVLGSVDVRGGRLHEAELWLDHAERVLHHLVQPTAALMLYSSRATLEFARGRKDEAMKAQRDVERMERLLVTPHVLATRTQAQRLMMLCRFGENGRVERALAEMDEDARQAGEMLIVLASLRVAQHEPRGATDALASIFTGQAPITDPAWEVNALLIEAIARDRVGDTGASTRALGRALDLAETHGLLLPFLLVPAPVLLERHVRLHTTHAHLVSEILNLLSGNAPAKVEPLREPLSATELRVLRYMPTNLPAPEIAAELFVSVNTVRSHIKHLYAKLGVHARTEAVKRARELGLLSLSSGNR